jgi:hypothetical protein
MFDGLLCCLFLFPALYSGRIGRSGNVPPRGIRCQTTATLCCPSVCRWRPGCARCRKKLQENIGMQRRQSCSEAHLCRRLVMRGAPVSAKPPGLKVSARGDTRSGGLASRRRYERGTGVPTLGFSSVCSKWAAYCIVAGIHALRGVRVAGTDVERLVSRRDLDALAWVGEQYAVHTDQLGAFLNCTPRTVQRLLSRLLMTGRLTASYRHQKKVGLLRDLFLVFVIEKIEAMKRRCFVPRLGVWSD